MTFSPSPATLATEGVTAGVIGVAGSFFFYVRLGLTTAGGSAATALRTAAAELGATALPPRALAWLAFAISRCSCEGIP